MCHLTRYSLKCAQNVLRANRGDLHTHISPTCIAQSSLSYRSLSTIRALCEFPNCFRKPTPTVVGEMYPRFCDSHKDAVDEALPQVESPRATNVSPKPPTLPTFAVCPGPENDVRASSNGGATNSTAFRYCRAGDNGAEGTASKPYRHSRHVYVDTDLTSSKSHYTPPASAVIFGGSHHHARRVFSRVVEEDTAHTVEVGGAGANGSAVNPRATRAASAEREFNQSMSAGKKRSSDRVVPFPTYATTGTGDVHLRWATGLVG